MPPKTQPIDPKALEQPYWTLTNLIDDPRQVGVALTTAPTHREQILADLIAYFKVQCQLPLDAAYVIITGHIKKIGVDPGFKIGIRTLLEHIIAAVPQIVPLFAQRNPKQIETLYSTFLSSNILLAAPEVLTSVINVCSTKGLFAPWIVFNSIHASWLEDPNRRRIIANYFYRQRFTPALCEMFIRYATTQDAKRLQLYSMIEPILQRQSDPLALQSLLYSSWNINNETLLQVIELCCLGQMVPSLEIIRRHSKQAKYSDLIQVLIMHYPDLRHVLSLFKSQYSYDQLRAIRAKPHQYHDKPCPCQYSSTVRNLHQVALALLIARRKRVKISIRELCLARNMPYGPQTAPLIKSIILSTKSIRSIGANIVHRTR